MKETLIVLPYVESPKQGNEIDMAIMGWHLFADFDFKFVVIGDRPNCLDRFNDVIHIPFERVKQENVGKNYLPHIDVARKFDKIYDLYHDQYEGFIWTTDDDYPIHHFDLDFIKKTYYLEQSFVGRKDATHGFWAKDMYKTRCLLDKLKKPHVNYATHHPMWFDFEKWNFISKEFNLGNDSLVRENLYFNYYKHDDPIQVDNVRLGIWNENILNNNLELSLKNENIKFVVNSVAGYSSKIERDINNHFKRYIKERLEEIDNGCFLLK